MKSLLFMEIFEISSWFGIRLDIVISKRRQHLVEFFFFFFGFFLLFLDKPKTQTFGQKPRNPLCLIFLLMGFH